MDEIHFNTQEPPSDFGIRLMDGEEMIFSLRPYRFVRYAATQAAFVLSFLFLLSLILLVIILTIVFFAKNNAAMPPVMGLFVCFGIMTALSLFVIGLSGAWGIIAERRYHYWLTNKRVIWCHGFIGYQVRSVPLERVADVVISRTLPELLAGMSSIEIRDMTGQFQARGGLGGKWIGVKEAPEVQKRILEEIKRVNEGSRKL